MAPSRATQSTMQYVKAQQSEMQHVAYAIMCACVVCMLSIAALGASPAWAANSNTSRIAATTKASQKAPSATTQPKSIPMYRLYNPKTGEHLYTSQLKEKRVLSQQRGWQFEGIAWYAPEKSDTPVYRLFKDGAHHYTASENERKVLLTKRGWTDEGIGWYSDDNETIAVHRVVKPGAAQIRAHHYTTSTNERDTLTKKRGWKSEGVGWYALAEGKSLKDGWIKKSGKWTYWLEGKQLKGQDRWLLTCQRPTSKSDEGIRRYRIGADGFAKTGFFILDGAKYYAIPTKIHVVHFAHHHKTNHTLVADKAGKLYNGSSGFKWSSAYTSDKSKQRYYFEPTADKKAMAARVGKFVKDDKLYYGYPTKGYLARNTMLELDGKSYIADENGVLTEKYPYADRVPQIYQNPELPTGCESVALTMVLRAHGFSLGKTTIADKYLTYSGDDFVNHFVGNPYGAGAGIFAPGLTNTANRFLKAKGSSLRAHNVSGASFERLLDYTKIGRPVLIWSTMYMNPSPHFSGIWSHGKQWYNYEHCVVMRGTSGGKVLVNDPLSGSVKRSYTAFRDLYYRCGSMAVVLW